MTKIVSRQFRLVTDEEITLQFCFDAKECENLFGRLSSAKGLSSQWSEGRFDEATPSNASDTVVNLLDQGIRCSINRPLYVEVNRKPRKSLGFDSNLARELLFLTNEGLIIVARGGVVRDAFFPYGIKGDGTTRWTLFREGWRYLNLSAKREATDDDSGWVDVKMISDGNWQYCPK